MKLTADELAYVRSLGLYVTEKCGQCGKLLNQTVRYTIKDRPEVYCSAVCRDTVFFGDSRIAKNHSTPGHCAYCGASLKGKRRGTLFCDQNCKRLTYRNGNRETTRQPKITGTPAQANQGITDPKNGDKGNRMADPSTALILRARARIPRLPKQDG